MHLYLLIDHTGDVAAGKRWYTRARLTWLVLTVPNIALVARIWIIVQVLRCVFYNGNTVLDMSAETFRPPSQYAQLHVYIMANIHSC